MKNFHRNQLCKVFRKIVDTVIILSLVLSMLNLPHTVYASPETIPSDYTDPNPILKTSASHLSGIHIDESLEPVQRNLLQISSSAPTYAARVIESGYLGGIPTWGSVSFQGLAGILGASDSNGAIIESTACPKAITPYIIVDLGQALYLNGTTTDGWAEMRVYRNENPNLTNLYLDVSADYQNWYTVAGKYDTGGAAAWWTIGGVYTGYVRFARVRVSRNSGCHSVIMNEHLDYEFDSIRMLG